MGDEHVMKQSQWGVLVGRTRIVIISFGKKKIKETMFNVKVTELLVIDCNEGHKRNRILWDFYQINTSMQTLRWSSSDATVFPNICMPAFDSLAGQKYV